MDLLQGQQLVTTTGRSLLANHALKNKTVIAFYFSAHWCPPCRQFTPVLAAAHSASRAGPGAAVEVVFVSSDRSAAAQAEYMQDAHGAWLAVPHDSVQLRAQLSARCEVQGIPALVVLTAEGDLVTKAGREEVLASGSAAFSVWAASSLTSLDTSAVTKLVAENEPGVARVAAGILVRLLGNVVRQPTDIKYRQIKLTNKKIADELLVANGAFEILFTVGFEEDDDKLILPLSVSVVKIEKFLEAITNLSIKN